MSEVIPQARGLREVRLRDLGRALLVAASGDGSALSRVLSPQSEAATIQLRVATPQTCEDVAHIYIGAPDSH